MNVKKLVDNVTKFEMRFSGLLNTSLVFEKKGDERTVDYDGPAFTIEDATSMPRTLTKKEWDELFYKIFGECKVMNYPKKIKSNYAFLDGEIWNMHIEFANRRAKNTEGHYAYPDNWNELTKVLSQYYSWFYTYEEENEEDEEE